MKKIINGKLYDTETARKLGEHSPSLSVTDFGYYKEEIYRKRTGEYFLHGEGNAASPYSSYAYGLYGSGEKIVPISYDDARKWMERNASPKEYQDEFGEIFEDESKITWSFSLTTSNLERLRRAAKESGSSMSAIIDSLIAGM